MDAPQTDRNDETERKPSGGPAPAFEPQKPQTLPLPSPAGATAQPEFEVRPRANGLAIASLVSSIALLFVCAPAAIVSVVLGAIALHRIRTSRGMEQGRGMAIAGIIIGVVGVLVGILAVVVFPKFLSSVRRGFGGGGVQQLKWGLQSYMYSSDGVLPERLEDLYPEHVRSTDAFRDGEDPDALRTTRGFLTSFRYVGSLREPTSNVIVLYRHAPDSRDRRIAFTAANQELDLTEEELKARLLLSFESVKKRRWDSYSEQQREEIEEFYAMP